MTSKCQLSNNSRPFISASSFALTAPLDRIPCSKILFKANRQFWVCWSLCLLGSQWWLAVGCYLSITRSCKVYEGSSFLHKVHAEFWCITWVIFAGLILSLVHESRCICCIPGRFDRLPLAILSRSLSHISTMVDHPKQTPSLQKSFVPLGLELCSAEITFFSCSMNLIIIKTIHQANLVGRTNEVHNMARVWVQEAERNSSDPFISVPYCPDVPQRCFKRLIAARSIIN